jgi:hypothetical protein
MSQTLIFKMYMTNKELQLQKRGDSGYKNITYRIPRIIID